MTKASRGCLAVLQDGETAPRGAPEQVGGGSAGRGDRVPAGAGGMLALETFTDPRHFPPV